MKLQLTLLLLLNAVTSEIIAQEAPSAPSREHIRVVHQDISKWDKNGDGKLTGRERDAFTAAKRKELADAAAAAQAAKSKPPRPVRFKPALSLEDAQKPTPKGVAKNLEDAASGRSQ